MTVAEPSVISDAMHRLISAVNDFDRVKDLILEAQMRASKMAIHGLMDCDDVNIVAYSATAEERTRLKEAEKGIKRLLNECLYRMAKGEFDDDEESLTVKFKERFPHLISP